MYTGQRSEETPKLQPRKNKIEKQEKRSWQQKLKEHRIKILCIECNTVKRQER